ncbi:hypothetical protein [Kitasatospora sp. NBC_01539]|uniref:F0F1 ATP synthase subunit B family protein n=1 Tax=Kitasatospora sp. NBC_01539 TaxID=2903577 RepID=UPI0038602EF0
MDLGPLKPNVTELALGLLCFFTVFGILGRLVLPRIERTLAARFDATEGRLERAEEARGEAMRIDAERRAGLNAARHEAAAVHQAAVEEGAALLASARAEGQRRRDAMVAEARVRLAADRVIAEVELRGDVTAAAVELAGRIVGEPLAGLPRTDAVVEAFFAQRETAGVVGGPSGR